MSENFLDFPLIIKILIQPQKVGLTWVNSLSCGSMTFIEKASNITNAI